MVQVPPPQPKNKHRSKDGVYFFFESCATPGKRPTANNSEGEAVANDIPRGCHGRRADRGIFNAVKNERPCGQALPHHKERM